MGDGSKEECKERSLKCEAPVAKPRRASAPRGCQIRVAARPYRRFCTRHPTGPPQVSRHHGESMPVFCTPEGHIRREDAYLRFNGTDWWR